MSVKAKTTPLYIGVRHVQHPATMHINSLDEYATMHRESIEHPDSFWKRLATELLTWSKPFVSARQGSLAAGNSTWFPEGQLNASYNCIDRHAIKTPEKAALIYEADEATDSRTITFSQLLSSVCKLAWVLKQTFGVRKGDVVAVYLPMIPEAAVVMLACARIGAIHSVVFAGFSADALHERILDAKCKVVVTADEGKRGGKSIELKAIVDTMLSQEPRSTVSEVLVFQRTGNPISWVQGRDYWWHEECPKWPSYLAPEPMNSEDPLFLLYTSGSTGKPKGLMHSTGGYLTGAAATGKYVFDIHSEDRFFCGGDVGWITGHTYVVYAPLLLGVTSIIFEGQPLYPTPTRYWEIIENHQITHFYVSPTALRLLKRYSGEVKNEMPHLRVLGSVGEPITAETWMWYYHNVGKAQAWVVDTYWQTETGSHSIAPLAAVTPTKPGSATLPFFGIEPAILDPVSGQELQGSNVEGVLVFKQAWPSMARTIWGDHRRYLETYMNVYEGYYFTGDGAARDEDGYYWIRGRVDDVVNVSSHRISTAEIEAALMDHESVAEAAVVGCADELTGQAISAFVALKAFAEAEVLRRELVHQVRRKIGAFAAPKQLYIVPDLPRTRSGKIMRRILRKVVAGEKSQLGDLTTLSDPSVVEQIVQTVGQQGTTRISAV